jgi:hypothetical protein
VKNKSFQDFQVQGQLVENVAQLWGEYAYVTAGGSFATQDGTATLPKRIDAFIERGNIIVGDTNILLPIKGTGYFDVMYLDKQLRIFRGNNGSLAIQTPADSLA